MSAAAPRYEPYGARTGREWMLTLGSADGPQLVLLAPLFEELNFTRRLLADILRGLAARGIGGWLPDLPGTGESLLRIDDIALVDWRDAVREAGRHVARVTGATPHVASLRGGALLDDAIEARSRWRFEPSNGAALLRHLERAQSLSNAEDDALRFDNTGYILGDQMLRELGEATPAACATSCVRNLVDTPFAAFGDRGRLWRRAEPAACPELSEAIAADIADWIGQCGGR